MEILAFIVIGIIVFIGLVVKVKLDGDYIMKEIEIIAKENNQTVISRSPWAESVGLVIFVLIGVFGFLYLLDGLVG